MSESASVRLRESSGGGRDKSGGEAMIVIKGGAWMIEKRDWSSQLPDHYLKLSFFGLVGKKKLCEVNPCRITI